MLVSRAEGRLVALPRLDDVKQLVRARLNSARVLVQFKIENTWQETFHSISLECAIGEVIGMWWPCCHV